MPTLPPPPVKMVLIPCTTTEGMFSGEVAVKIEIEGFAISLFADESLIVERNGESFLRVTFAGENGKPENKTVLLPSESFETGSRWLSIPERLLLAA